MRSHARLMPPATTFISDTIFFSDTAAAIDHRARLIRQNTTPNQKAIAFKRYRCHYHDKMLPVSLWCPRICATRYKLSASPLTTSHFQPLPRNTAFLAEFQ